MASIPTLAEEIVRALEPALDLPFVFFGHSMGATVATEVVRALESARGPLPAHLIVSGRRPPHVPGLETRLSPLPDPAFVEEVQRRYGGIPAALLAEPDVMALLLPAMRADFAALEGFQPGPRAPLSLPITVFGGSEDPLTPREHLEAWRGETHRACNVRVFPGGHFYLTQCLPDVLEAVALLLAPLQAGVEATANP